MHKTLPRRAEAQILGVRNVIEARIESESMCLVVSSVYLTGARAVIVRASLALCRRADLCATSMIYHETVNGREVAESCYA